MTKGYLRTLVLIIVVGLAVTIVCGCRTKGTGASGKTVQMLEQENKELASQIAAKDKEIAELKSSLAKSKEGSDTANKQVDQQMQSLGDEMLKMMEENAKLQQDVNSLKKQIEQMKAARTN